MKLCFQYFLSLFSTIAINLAVFLVFSCKSFSNEGITRPYVSTRNMGMGGVRMTTGLYDENFFNNPARITANPSSRFTIFDITALETNTSLIQNLSRIKNVFSGGDFLNQMSAISGIPLHFGLQLSLPAYYRAATEDRKSAWALGLFAHAHMTGGLRNSLTADVVAVADVGPAFTYGRKFLDDKLSVGATAHLVARAAAVPEYGATEYIQGESLGIQRVLGAGAMVDFDLGATYQFASLFGFDFSAAISTQNLMGGGYQHFQFGSIGAPAAQPRSYGLGVSAEQKGFWIFDHTVFALELSDIGNNQDIANGRQGGFSRLVHLGAELKLKAFVFRLGLNQGYWTAGFGFVMPFMTVNLASYAEELGLNAGTRQDRRYVFGLGFYL